MSSRRDSRFLPIFFIVLGIVFLIAVWVRIRAYTPAVAREHDEKAAPSTTSRVTSGSATSPVIAPEMTYTIEPDEDPVALAARRAAEAQERLLRVPIAAATRTAAPTGIASAQRPAVSASTKTATTSRTPAAVASTAPPRSSQASSGGSSTGGQTARSSASSSTRDTRKETPADERNPKDATSDTTPPQLVSIEFNPPQIEDGQETALSVVATDDLSGVRVISGTVITPTGGLQGFAVQREGDSPRYSTRIAVPKDAPEGLWRVTYLSLSDNAGNTATLSANAGTLGSAGFRVTSSRSDTKPPVLRAVWLDRPAMRAGEKNIIFVQADDEGTGVNLISGVFQSPSKFARIGFGCHAADPAWQCEFMPPPSADCGEWRLEQIQLQDKANNMATARSDNPLITAVHLNIGGNDCDSQPPQMQSIVLDRNVVSNVEKTAIVVTANVTDDMSGVSSISGQVTGPPSSKGTPRLYFSMSAGGDPAMWTGQIIIPALAAKGQWEIAWIQILDKANNLRTYSRSDAVLQRAVFMVQ